MALKNHYKTLGISTSASKADVVSAFRQLAKKWHPDISKLPNATENFCNIYEAYEILSDAKKKEVYDSLILEQLHTKAASSKPQHQTDYANYKNSNNQRSYYAWEQEAHIKADHYSRETFSVFTRKVKYAFTPKLQLTGWFENAVLPHFFLFGFFPAGLYMIWFSTVLPLWYKKTVTVVTAILFLAYLSLFFISK